MTHPFATDDRIKEVVEFALDRGDDETCDVFALTSESLSRYKRRYKSHVEKAFDVVGQFDRLSTLKQLGERFSDAELRALMQSKSGATPTRQTFTLPETSTLKVGVLTDTHGGSKGYSQAMLMLAFEEFAKAEVSRVFHCGDVTEGMSTRQGHIYELTPYGIGFAAQKALMVQDLSQWDLTPIDMIDGNHDRWYIKAVGALIVQDIAAEIPNAEYRGSDEADLYFGDLCVRLWHGEDGAAYAKSYRGQQVVRSLSEDDLPHVIILGHDHKAGEWEDRGCQIVAAGACSYQSAWMRRTRKSHDAGFTILTIEWDGEQVRSIQRQWFPAPPRDKANVWQVGELEVADGVV